jgi:hypothetical protein
MRSDAKIGNSAAPRESEGGATSDPRLRDTQLRFLPLSATSYPIMSPQHFPFANLVGVIVPVTQ